MQLAYNTKINQCPSACLQPGQLANHFVVTTTNFFLQYTILQFHLPFPHCEILTSVMIIIAGVSLREQHTDLLICHGTKDLSLHKAGFVTHKQISIGITYDKPTARTATVNVSTFARTKLYTKVISCISDVVSAVYADGPYIPEATSTTVMIEFVLPVGNLPSIGSKLPCVHVYFNFSHLNSR